VAAQNGQVLAELELPIAGLMSLRPFETVRGKLVVLRDIVRGTWAADCRSPSCS